MAEAQTAEVGGQSDYVERTAGGEGPISLRDAANSLLDTRRKDNAQQDTPALEGDDVPAKESPPQGDDTGPEAVPGETQGADAEAEKLPPIEPPRSWTKEDKELFNGLPRETQERLADRERSREREFSTRLNEAAEKSKGLTAKEQAAEQVRAQYEQALPMLLQSIQESHAGEFSDIKTIQDVERLAREDWPRYVQWDASQKKIAAVQQQTQEAQKRQEQEKSTKLKTFIAEQNALFLEKAPEMADDKKAAEIGRSAVTMLKDLGFTPAELSELWEGGKDISLRDHRVQLLIRDSLRYREAAKNVKTAQAKPVPQVVRPGVAQPRGAVDEERVKSLDARLTATGSLKDAVAALSARRAASR
jgi:hypothetical protein